jgi:sterol desaturase/sphingolipid hydroxylase (fatty acid hydroxylase superfamily)
VLHGRLSCLLFVTTPSSSSSWWWWCRHPIEHLYYFSCIFPSLYFWHSPFHFLFNGVHLLLSPAASHSGWEDHMQSDQFHYLHHRKFECNYGSASFPLDHLFGTFRRVMFFVVLGGGGGPMSV